MTDQTREWRRKVAAVGRHLPAEDERALVFLFNAFEGACGVRSVQGTIQDMLVSGTARPTGGATGNGRLDRAGEPELRLLPAEEWASGSVERRENLRAGSTRRAYLAMKELSRSRAGRGHAVVLFRFFGPRDPSAPWVTFGPELAPIACLTREASRLASDAADEEHRDRARERRANVLALLTGCAKGGTYLPRPPTAFGSVPCSHGRASARSPSDGPRTAPSDGPVGLGVALDVSPRGLSDTSPAAADDGALCDTSTARPPTVERVATIGTVAALARSTPRDAKLHLLAYIEGPKKGAPADRDIVLARVRSEAALLVSQACAAYVRALEAVS